MLTILDDQFLLDEKPFRILSGAIHYFRVVPEYWQDRLEKARLFGLNTVETYVPWNLHEPRPGEFLFDGMLDLVRFIRAAGELGLKVILRPGPYICSEWDFGGLPAWLLKDPAMQVRCKYPPYLQAVDRFFAAILPLVVPLQVSHGGPIIAVQVENEYGGYGNDHAYMLYLADGLRTRGIDSLLFTSDGPYDGHIQGGSLSGLLKTVNFAFGAKRALAKLRQYQPGKPLMVTEFWSGWFDHWGEARHQNAIGLPGFLNILAFKNILRAGASLNFYMFHGGTSFGFMNGANVDLNRYRADIGSYDYSAPLNEAGDFTPKAIKYHRILRQHIPALPELPAVVSSPRSAFGKVVLDEIIPLFDDALRVLSQPHHRSAPEPMENFDQAYGFILYRTQLPGPRKNDMLKLLDLHDRAQVFLDGVPIGTLEREFPSRTLFLNIPAPGARLDILVENMGRVNFGPHLMDRKGITHGVTLSGQLQFDWEIYPLPLDDLRSLAFSTIPATRYPALLRGTFDVPSRADTWLSLPGWTKGVVWLNGFALGRHWSRGPQRTLYIPAPLLQEGTNELIVLELEGTRSTLVEFIDHADLNNRRP